MTTERTKTGSTRSRRRPADSRSGEIRDEQRHEMIATAAYFRAEQRGFCGGDSLDDWLAAEAEVDARLRKASVGKN